MVDAEYIPGKTRLMVYSILDRMHKGHTETSRADRSVFDLCFTRY